MMNSKQSLPEITAQLGLGKVQEELNGVSSTYWVPASLARRNVFCANTLLQAGKHGAK